MPPAASDIVGRRDAAGPATPVVRRPGGREAGPRSRPPHGGRRRLLRAQSPQGTLSSSSSKGWVRLYQQPESSRNTASMP